MTPKSEALEHSRQSVNAQSQTPMTMGRLLNMSEPLFLICKMGTTIPIL